MIIGKRDKNKKIKSKIMKNIERLLDKQRKDI